MQIKNIGKIKNCFWYIFISNILLFVFSVSMLSAEEIHDTDRNSKKKYTVTLCEASTSKAYIWENVDTVEFSAYGSVRIISGNVIYVINKPCVKIEERKELETIND